MPPVARRIALFFGSRSVEHGVSVVTAYAVWQALRTAGFEVLPVYITQDGAWQLGRDFPDTRPYGAELFNDVGRYARAFAGQATEVTLLPRPSAAGPRLVTPPGAQRPQEFPFDVAFPATHGTMGEDGTLQGLFELASVPHAGCDVASAALSMDKTLMKRVFAAGGFRQVRSLTIARTEWETDSSAVLERIQQQLSYPLFVKPNALGSSKGVNPAPDEDQLFLALGVAAEVDDRILVEEAVQDPVEINVAVMGWGENVQASLCEQPKTGEWLDYDRKYKSGGNKLLGSVAGAGRKVPAEIPDALAETLRDQAKRVFTLLGCAGVARCDFLIDRDENVILNEINTIPGALSLELWQASGITPAEVVTHMVEIAAQRHAERSRSNRHMSAI
ncbi:MAG: D-alanine--D-alanine ligase family protein [Dehalococcoidia bacterium]